MFPIGDSPNPKGLPWITAVLILLNVGVYLLLLPQASQAADPKDPRFVEYVRVLAAEGAQAEGGAPRGEAPEVDPRAYAGQVSEYDLTVFEYGSRPAAWTWLTMLTSMFLHGGFMHLFGNMLFLWIYGNNVEHRLGRAGYLLAYLATGFLASFGDIALRPDSNIPGVGASGAISGVLGMYFLWFPSNKVRLLLLLPPVVRQVEVGARWVLGFYIVVQNIIPAFFSSGGGGGVAHGAHIGGFIGGVVVAALVSWRMRAWPSSEGKPTEAEKRSVGAAAPDDPVATLRGDLAAGRIGQASRAFFAAPRALAQAGLEPEDALRIGQGLEEVGEDRGALAAYERAVDMHPSGQRGAQAHLAAARVLAGPLLQPTMAYQHVVAALRAGASEQQVEEARAIMSEIRPQVGSVPGVRARL